MNTEQKIKIVESLKREIKGSTRAHLQESLVCGLVKSFKEAELKKNSALPSNSELSKLIGISHLTLRKALLTLGENGILQIKHGQGTFLNKDYSLRAAMTGTVVLLLPHLDGQYGAMADAISETLMAHGITLRLESMSWWKSTGEAERDSIPLASITDLIGVIRSPSIHPTALIKEIEIYKKMNNDFPAIFIDRHLDIEGISSVGFDDISAMSKMFDWVWQEGFRDIYFVYPEIANLNMRNAERAEGFKQAAGKYNYNSEMKFLSTQPKHYDDFTNVIIKHTLGQSSADIAFICAGDGVGLAIEESVKKIGTKNRRVQVTGFDRMDGINTFGQSFPSTIRDRSKLGKAAAQLLLKQLKNRNFGNFKTEHISLQPKLVFKPTET
jgi:DNA-binding LacI/PurR family transcriptional regulator